MRISAKGKSTPKSLLVAVGGAECSGPRKRLAAEDRNNKIMDAINVKSGAVVMVGVAGKMQSRWGTRRASASL